MNKERSDAGFRCWDRKQTLCLDDETELTGSVVDIQSKNRNPEQNVSRIKRGSKKL